MMSAQWYTGRTKTLLFVLQDSPVIGARISQIKSRIIINSTLTGLCYNSPDLTLLGIQDCPHQKHSVKKQPNFPRCSMGLEYLPT